jgi:hypothetical protein
VEPVAQSSNWHLTLISEGLKMPSVPVLFSVLQKLTI